jgi:class 3 adenylate cyclase
MTKHDSVAFLSETGPLISLEEWREDGSGPLDTAILFVDLVSSSEFGSVMGLREYAEYVESFYQLCVEQSTHLFENVLGRKYQRGLHYEFEALGDELAVFLHTGRPVNDVYQLLCLAIALKCGWLGAHVNRTRLDAGLATAELAAGVHFGKVWARRTVDGFHKRGFAINAAKRTESASRRGTRFRIFATDSAYKVVHRKLRNMLFKRQTADEMRGIVIPIGVWEIHDSFVDFSRRLAPRFTEGFEEVALQAMGTNTFDIWIHSCLQVWAEKKFDRVTDENLALCQHVLKMEPENAVALYHAGQAMRERDDFETAQLYLEDLTAYWPAFADGWLELGRLHLLRGNRTEAHRCILQARRHGVSREEQELPS